MESMDLVETLHLLAEQNLHGLSFLLAYGATWVICGFIWAKASERTAAIVTLFQGMIAFPVALTIAWSIGAIGADRPVADEITQLSVLIGTSQLLGLPFLIYLIVKHHYTLVPIAFAGITSMHFVLYSWLYQTPAYIVMAILISLGTLIAMLAVPSDSRPKAGPVRVCLLTGGLLLVTALFFLLIHLSA